MTAAKTKSNEDEDKAVMNKWNELNETIKRKGRFHPSEEVNRDNSLWQPNPKIYDVVNSYHVYCKLCGQHFYAHSVLTDINSFFQKHINTSLHKSNLMVNSYPDNLPIFTWEAYLETGRCNLCEISGLYAYIINSTLNSKILLHLHNCDWEKNFRENNGKIVFRIIILKQFCNVNLLKDLFIIEDDSNYKCWLCNIKLGRNKEKSYYHLLLDDHFKRFNDFLRKIFQMTLSDLLNGFNLERVIKWALYEDMKPYRVSEGALVDCDEHMKCFKQSNDTSNIYEKIESGSGFAPFFIKEILKIQNKDFIYKNTCLLCEEELKDPFHMISESHCKKLETFDEFNCDKDEKYEICIQNQSKRLRPYEIQIKMFEHLLNELKACNIELGEIYKEGFTEVFIKSLKEKIRLMGLNDFLESSKNKSAENSKPTYVQELIEKKLNKLKSVFTYISGSYTNCEVCDHKLPVHAQEQHSSGREHRAQLESWKILKVKLKISKFTEPVVKYKTTLMCLICGWTFSEDVLFSHFKTVFHSENFAWYETTPCSTPISSCFSFDDECCFCKLCNTQISKSNVSLKATMAQIIKHWPCVSGKKGIQGLFRLSLHPDNCSEKVGNNESDSLMKNENRVKGLSVLCVNCGLPFGEKEISDHVGLCTSVGTVKFCIFKETVRNIVNLFEDKIIQNVTESFCKVVDECLQSEGNASRDSSQKNEKTVERENDLAETEISEQIPDNENTAQVSEVLNEKLDEANDTKKLETADAQKLQKKEDEIAQEGSKKEFLLDPKQLQLAIANVQAQERSGIRPYILRRDIAFLMNNPLRLINFCNNLISQSVIINTPMERARESFVCDTIVAAVLSYYANSKCYGFGSRLSGLTTVNSDFDVFLDCGGMFDGINRTGDSSDVILEKVGCALKRRPECRNIKIIGKARVPIVSFLHVPTNLYCDLSFKNGLSVQNTKLLRFMVSLDPRVKPIILFLKFWANVHCLQGPPCFSSYAITLMVIFYLQQLPNPILPAVETLQKNYIGVRLTIDGWDCNFSEDASRLPKTTNNEPFQNILLGFFDFYANFKYSEYVISPLTGKPVLRTSFAKNENFELPASYARHIVNLPIQNYVNQNIPIVIIDPFDLGHILTKSFPQRTLPIFIELCNLSATEIRRGMAMRVII